MKQTELNKCVVGASLALLVACTQQHESPSYEAKSADILVTGAPLSASVNSGHSGVFTIRVLNQGPNDASHVQISDQLGAQSKLDSITCAAAGRAACPAAVGKSMIVDVLPVNGSLTFTVTAELPNGSTGTILNSMSASYYGDPNPNDNAVNDDILVR